MDTTDEPIRRIAVGVDGSPHSLAALRWAVREAEQVGAGIDAVISWDFPYLAYTYPVALPPDDDLAAAARQSLEDALASIGPTAVPITRVVVHTNPTDALLTAAEDCDLLVLGSRGRGSFRRTLLGSVTLNCIGHADCPVVVVPLP